MLLFADLKGENIGKKSLKIHSVGVEGLGILSRMGHWWLRLAWIGKVEIVSEEEQENEDEEE